MKEKNVVDLALSTAVNGAKQAITTVQDVFGTPKDTDVQVYQALDERDFQELEAVFGAEDTVEYIRKMETKLQKSGR